MLSIIFLTLLFLFIGTYLSYFIYIKKNVRKPWKLKIDREFEPKITILVPTHNEESTIEAKLENIKNISYPKEKIELIIADDSSDDNTVKKVEKFIQKKSDLNIKLIRQNPRAGKSATLNKALKIVTNHIIIVSDADTLWPKDILRKALPYLSDPKVGAVTGRGINRNSDDSWIIKSENTYLQLANLLRLGESKIYSTIRFEGGFCAYRKDVFERFDCETGSDDSGTALEVVQRGYRTILIPEVVFYTDFPERLVGKLKIKVRRANQLIGLWVKSLKLLLKRRLKLPKRIAIPEIFLFIFNPIIFVILAVTGILLILFNPLFPIILIILLTFTAVIIFSRQYFIEIVINNLILLYALITFIFKRRYIAW